MLAIAWYLLKVLICSGILVGYYWVALRNNKFHQYNRFYLLGSVAMAWIIPVIKIDFWIEPEQPGVFNLLATVARGDQYVADADMFAWDWAVAATVLFIAVSAFLLLRLLIMLIKIKILIASNPNEKLNNIWFVYTDAKGTPFSFFKYIFWNNAIQLNSPGAEQIIKHELAHVYQKHSFDKLFLSVALIPGWYNPFMWIIKKELHMIHEFIADQKAVSDGDPNLFALMLLNTAYPSQANFMINPFFHSPIKRRLIMLTKNYNPRFSYLQRLMILPLLCMVLLFFAFRQKEKYVQKSAPQNEAVTTDSAPDTTAPEFPGGQASWRRYLARNLDAAVMAKAGAPEGTYKVVLQFKVSKDGTISNVEALTNHGYGVEDEAMKMIKKGPKWQPAKSGDKFVDAIVTQNITFVVGSTADTVNRNQLPQLIFFDGKKITETELKRKLAELEGKKGKVYLSSYTIMKGPELKKYGEEGKNGVTLFTTRPINDYEQEAVRLGTPQQEEKYPKVFSKVENPPSFKKENSSFSEYVKVNLRYPKEAFANKIQGKVAVKFIVDRNGELSNFEPLTSLNYGLEKEAIRLIKNSGPWKPAVQNGRNVSFQVNQEIEFLLPEHL